MMHATPVQSLQHTLASLGENQRLVVVSHHLPAWSLIEEKYNLEANKLINSAYACDIACANDPKIATWIYRHTHTRAVNGKFMCNPYGYPGENETTLVAMMHVDINDDDNIADDDDNDANDA